MVKVLLIDDEDIVRKIVRVVLEAEGYDVLEAAEGTTGLQLVVDHAPDVVVLDLMMPGEFGTDVCRKIKDRSPDTKVIVLTSLPASEARAQVDEVGADDFMEKPFSSLELVQRLDDLSGR